MFVCVLYYCSSFNVFEQKFQMLTKAAVLVDQKCSCSSILIQFIYLFPVSAAMTTGFSITWSFRNYSNMFIWCSRNIYYHQYCIISTLNKKFRTAFIWQQFILNCLEKLVAYLYEFVQCHLSWEIESIYCIPAK